MRFRILGCGTSTGVPIPGCLCKVCTSDHPRNKRNRTSALIILDNGAHILIDAGPDLRQQALRWSVNQVDAVLFTHSHADHILGIEDLRGYNFARNGAPIPCYATQDTFDQIKKVFFYIFDPDPEYKGGLLARLSTFTLNHYVPFEIESQKILPFALLHGPMPVTGYRIGNLAYATDCNHISHESLQYLNGLDYLFLDGLRYDAHQTHFTIDQAVKVAQQIRAKKTYLVHMTHSVDYVEVNKDLPDGIELAYDGLEVDFC